MKVIMTVAAFVSQAAMAPVVWAQTDNAEDRFVESNLNSVFYHELGHAVIDLMQLPIFGQEEDAADVLSVLMIHELFEEDAAQIVAYDAAFGFQAEAEARDGTYFWDVHGPDEQRYYNLVCLFYGGSVDTREELADELGLPEERKDTCEDEFQLASDSWGPVLEDMSKLKGRLRFESKEKNSVSEMIAREVEFLNKTYGFPQDIEVNVEACGEANAFYDLNLQSITICSEFESHLRAQFSKL